MEQRSENTLQNHSQVLYQPLVTRRKSESDLQKSLSYGKKIYSENSFFQDFIKLMQNSIFHDFYTKYFQNWSDIQTMVFYMKVYKAIEYGYKSQYNESIQPEFMTFILHKVMTTTPLRKAAFKIFNNFKESSLSDQQIFNQLIDYSSLSKEKLLIIN